MSAIVAARLFPFPAALSNVHRSLPTEVEHHGNAKPETRRSSWSFEIWPDKSTAVSSLKRPLLTPTTILPARITRLPAIHTTQSVCKPEGLFSPLLCLLAAPSLSDYTAEEQRRPPLPSPDPKEPLALQILSRASFAVGWKEG